MSPTIIKYLIAFLAASFLFACAAEAQTSKSQLPGNNANAFAVTGFVGIQ